MQMLVKKLEAVALDKTSKLTAKKDKSFMTMDIHRWEMDPAVAKNKNLDLKDRNTAY